jgi:hypothetical protein
MGLVLQRPGTRRAARPRHRTGAAAVACLAGLLAMGCASSGTSRFVLNPRPPPQPTEQDILQEMQGDRPDLTNGTHIVPTALVQLESGGVYSGFRASGHSTGVPVSLRLGLTDWLEARLETGGPEIQSSPARTLTTLAGVTLGAKLRLWSLTRSSLAVGIEPDVGLPAGSARGTDVGCRVIASSDVGDKVHGDANYTIASIGSAGARFLQHGVSLSISYQLTERASPYAEAYWLSRQEAAGKGVGSIDLGIVYLVSERLAIDGGADLGITRPLPRPSLFAGLSVILGEVTGHRGVHQRLREAAARQITREKGR